MPEYRTVCRLDELKLGEGKTVVAGERLIALFRDDKGCHAIDDTCPHMGASLAAGCLEDGIVTCPWHAWRFRVTDGTWADNPRVKIPAYCVRVIDDNVQVEIPDTKTSQSCGGAA